MIAKTFVSYLDRHLRSQLIGAEGMPKIDFRLPAGEPALAPADSVSWRVFRNPLSLYIGGITAVLLELAEPRVRSGVWEHTTFRDDPLGRMRRTGMAAMVTVYGARSISEKMIAKVRAMHSRIEGNTPAGVAYRAEDPELLRWVHATALFGFMEAYDRFVCPLSAVERDHLVAEGVPAAILYGATGPPSSEAELASLLEKTLPELEPSDIVFEFLRIIRKISLFPLPLRPFNHLMIRASVSLLPAPAREKLGLGKEFDLSSGGERLLRALGSRVDRLHLASFPASQACVRLGLPPDSLAKRTR